MVGMRRMRELNAVQLIGGAASLVLNLLLVVALRGGVEAALGVQAVVAFAQASAMFAIAQRSVSGSSNAGVSGRLSREMLSFSLRGYWGSLSTLIWTRSTIFLLNGYHGPAAVGIFSVSQQLAEKMLLPGQALHDVVFHKVSTVSRPNATAIVNRYIRMMLWGMLPVAGLGALVAPPLIALLFGHAYLAAANVLRVLLLGGIVMSPCLLLVPYFLGQLRRPGLLSILAWINVLINLALAVLLVPVLAEIGAAVALVLTQVVGTAIVFAFYLRAAQTSLARATWLQCEDVALILHQVRALRSER